jgi:putative pyruvate formate lyase activating enzyme
MKTGDFYTHCTLCPRRCGVNRYEARGWCGEGAALRAAYAGLHRGEEPPITGRGGSGTVFISGCNLGCNFCQNWQISHRAGNAKDALGCALSPAAFAEICLKLEAAGAENINIVTGSHAIPALAEALLAAREAGLGLPILWNTSSYESPEALDLLRGLVDIWLPDLKTLDSTVSSAYFKAPDYPAVASQAILKMAELIETSPSRLPADMPRLLLRHLTLPGSLEDTRAVLRWYAEHLNGRPGVALSLMSQYTETGRSTEAPRGHTTQSDYEALLEMLEDFGIEEGFCQELVTDDSWLPDFTRPNPFSTSLSTPVWHCEQ